MNHGKKRLAAWLMAAAMILSLLPGGARAEEVSRFQPLTGSEELVTGQYVLLSSQGYAPGILQDGSLAPVQPVLDADTLIDAAGALWQLEVRSEGVLLTDPAGTPIAPGESDETGLISGAYSWTVTCTDGRFSFFGFAGETEVTLARCADLGFRAYRTPLAGELYDNGFTLYRVTEQEAEPSEPDEEPEETTQPSSEPEQPSEPNVPTEPGQTSGPRLYFGLLHSHTADSSGVGTPAEAYSYAADIAGLDFLAITDHSSAFDGAEDGTLGADGSAVSSIWQQGKEAAANAATDSFLALYGFEMDWQNGLGHIGTFFTPGFQSRDQADFADPAAALENYYAALNTVPGSVGQFNHPGAFYGDFEAFGHYSEAADAAMQLLEVIDEGSRCLDAYTRALDAGWHVAPTASQNNQEGQWGDDDSSRTVVYADALTEQAFAAALQNRRVYATEDSDLEILFSLDGNLFGSILRNQAVGDTIALTASLRDPTDGSIGKVEVIVDGGVVAAQQEVTESTAQISFELPSTFHYYYLRITQADGDIAVTAPVWIDQGASAEITDFSADTVLAVQNRPFNLRVEVQNRDSEEFSVQQVIFRLEGQEIGSVSDPAVIPGNSNAVYEASLTCAAAGQAEIQVTVSGTIAGYPVECTASLNLNFLTEDLVTTMVIDGSHSPLPDLTELEALASRHRVVLVKAAELTPDILSSCDVLLIPAPERDFYADYVNLIANYLQSGRTLILCGQADRDNPDCAHRLNSLLQALSLTARFRDDTAYDPSNNSGRADALVTTAYNSSDPLVSGIRQLWNQTGGCTVDPGEGTWLVKGHATAFSIDGDRDGAGALEETYTETAEGTDVTHSLVVAPGDAVLLAREETAFGGRVFLSGGLFSRDEVLDPGGENVWDTPNGNGSLMEAILEIQRETLPLLTTVQAKASANMETVRVQGYVTAGTAVEGNRFPNMIYIQDAAGGLGVADFTAPGVSVGTPVELYLLRDGDTFRLLHWQPLDTAAYNHQPKTPGCKDAVNHDLYGDQLVQVEGRVVQRTLTEDGKGVSAFTLEDREGNRVTVRIEDYILSASTGENTLAEVVTEGSWVSAIGIVYRHGGQTVLRVRNCDEVTAVRETGKTYRVVKGEYSVWIRKDGGSIYMEVDGPGQEFLGIELDGKRIDKSSYQTTDAENLIFRFWPRYLKTLELGTHSVVFKFRNGEAKATLVVWNHADNPYTGDPILLHLGLMLLSGGLLVKKRRR